MLHYIADVGGLHWEMMLDELMAVLQDHDSSDGTATKQFFITWVLFDYQITAV